MCFGSNNNDPPPQPPVPAKDTPAAAGADTRQRYQSIRGAPYSGGPTVQYEPNRGATVLGTTKPAGY